LTPVFDELRAATQHLGFRTRLFSLLLLALLSLQGCRWPGQAEDAGALVLSGTVDAHEVELGFQVGGRIARLQGEEGRAVQVGQVLAELDPTDLRLGAERTRAQAESAGKVLAALKAGARPQEIRAAQAAVAQAQADKGLADQQVARTQMLVNQNFVSPDQMDRARSVAAVSAARVDQAAANLSLLRAGARKEDLERAAADAAAAQVARRSAERQLTYVTLASPVAGVVSVRLAEGGQVVAAGQPVFRVAELSRPWVRAYLAEPDLPKVKLGQHVNVRVDGVPDRTFRGHLSFISPQAEFTPKTVETRALRVDLVYRVTVDVDDPGGLLKIGMPADVTFGPSSSS
jgi:HlyD family secretion protein